jgi:3-phenylpropionate/trans-cinnamate dioxygenase ferredoxin subunit
MPKYVIGTVRETPPGTQREVRVRDLTIALFNVDGSYYAILNRCPHQGAPLAKGTPVGRVESTAPGEYIYDPCKCLLKCAWHGWEFDLRTGQSWFNPTRKRVRPYVVTVEKGEAILESERSGEGRLPGPYIAETYDVSVEDNYLVISLSR